jgi:hypothetical protein
MSKILAMFVVTRQHHKHLDLNDIFLVECVLHYILEGSDDGVMTFGITGFFDFVQRPLF